LSLTAQKEFEGVVTYDSKAREEGMEEIQLSYWVYLKNHSVRSEESIGEFKKIRIFHVKNNEYCVLLELLGQRFAVCDNISNISKSGDRQNLKVKIGKEKKVIAGYKCKSAVLSNEYQTIKVFFTEELPNWSIEYPDLPGMPLEIEFEIDGLKVHQIAVDVSEESLEDYLFEIPDSYEKLTQEEFQEKFGTISTK
jgi:GLPGLI family protein